MRFFAFTLILAPFLSLVQALQYHSADFSSLILLEESGLQYYDPNISTSTPEPFETILARHGTNLARIRVWTSTNYSDYSLQYGLDMAKRAVAAGMDLYIDLHYSDTADPGHQAIPSGWPQDLAGLKTQIYNYTESLVTSFADQGTPITFVAIGNEINDGLLWPVGQVSVNGYTPGSELLHSAATAVRAAASSVSPNTRTLVHIANGWDAEASDAWWAGMLSPNGTTNETLELTDVDMMGFSFYPFYGTNATLDALEGSLQGIVGMYDKDVMVVETDWPVTACSNGTTLSEPTIPASISGQQEWVAGIRNVVSSLPNGRGMGISYWEPGWVGNAALGSACADNLLVDSNGTARASINMFYEDM